MTKISIPAWLENDQILIVTSEREDEFKDSQVVTFPPESEDKKIYSIV